MSSEAAYDWHTYSVEVLWPPVEYLFIACGVLYVPVWMGLQALAEKKQWRRRDLRTVKLIHNVVFSLFSLLLGIEALLLFYETLQEAEWSFWGTCCVGTWIHSRYGHAIPIFAASKLLELTETFHKILERRPVEFLHWFHHIVTYWFSVYCVLTGNPASIWYTWMNLWVHAVMYYYFAIVTYDPKRKPKWAFFVTLSQVLQMFVGTAVAYISAFGCGEVHSEINAYSGLVMYLIYIYLFVDLLYGKYFGNRRRPPREKQPEQGKKKQ